jgi:hypothetical protein
MPVSRNLMYNELPLKVSMILSIMILVFSPFSLAEKEVYISTGFVSGNTFRVLDAVSQNIYAQGVIDGILIAPMYGRAKT